MTLTLPIAAPTLDTGGTESSTGVLTDGSTSDTGSWGLNGEYSTAADRFNGTITPAAVAKVETPESPKAVSPQVPPHGREGGWLLYRRGKKMGRDLYC